MAKFDPSTVVTVNCSEVQADFDWNARRGIQDEAQESSENTTEAGFLDIMVSIARNEQKLAVNGQKQPVVVRPHPRAGETVKGRKMPAFFLCSGFQRYKAITEIAAGEHDDYLNKHGFSIAELAALKTDKPTIRVFVRNLNDFEARKENIQENTQRASLAAPDIAFGMADLFKLDKSLTTEQVGDMLGISQPYASVLKRTYDGLKVVNVPASHTLNPDKKHDVNLAEVWRQESVLPKKDKLLKVAELSTGKGDAVAPASAEEKLEAYSALRPKKDEPAIARGKGAWITNSIEKHAVTIGTMLGNLQRDGAIELVDIEAKHVSTLLASFVNLPTEAAHSKLKADNPNGSLPDYDTAMDSIAVAIKKAFNKGLAPAPVKASKSKDPTELAGTTDGIPAGAGLPPKKAKKMQANGGATA